MNIKIKEKRGITLISLVVTIILLLILAGISIAMLTGENGIFKTAQKAKLESQKGTYREIIELAKNENEITTDRERTKTEKLDGISEILNKDKNLGQGTGTKITKEYQDKENPRLVVKTKEGWVYIVTVDGIKELGKVDGDIPLDIDVKNGDIKYIYEPNYWTNSDVEVSLSIAKEEYKEFKIQYSYDLKTWKDYTEKIVVENNKAIYSRITTGTSVSKSYATGNITNIDKTEAEISTAMNSSNVTTKGFTVNVGVTDVNSGLGKILWYYKKSNETTYNSEEVVYKELHSTQSGETVAVIKSKTYDNLTSGTYNVYAEIYDVAGNVTSANSSEKPLEITLGTVTGLTEANTTFKAEPTDWTNGKVTVTASTNVSRYTIQTTKTPTVESSWKSTAIQEFETNGKVYARLWDGTNAGGYSVENVTNIDTLAPKDFTPTAESTTNSIKVRASTTDAEATSDNGKSGIAGYRFKLDSGSWTGYQTSGEYTWNNLTQTTNHTITVEAKDNAGNTKQGTASKGTGTVAGLTTANTTFTASPTGWTNGKVTMTASTNVSGYTIQTTKTPTVESSWKDTASQEFTENGKIYARLWDGTNAGGYSTGNVTNIDTLAPKDFTPTATSTTKSITVSANTTDAEATNTSASSGIAGYRFKLDSGSWTEYQASGTYKWGNLTQTTNHTITVEAKDNAGNTKQATVTKGTGTVAGLTTANTTFKANPDTWTSGKVTMTASTNVSGYTIQTTKTPTVESSWKSTASQEFTENGKIYARLWDGTNAGGYSVGNVTNIDKLAPNGFTPTATSTTNSITVKANTTDAEATSTSGKSGISGYRFKLDSGSWTGYQTSGEYTWNNLTQTTNHTITVEARDTAGNTKQGTVSKGTGTVSGLTTANTKFTAEPTGWTNGKVTMTASTNVSGYTIQTTKTPTVESSWKNTASQEFTENGKIYARLWDGTNAGGYSTGNVTNIDTLSPKGFTPTATSTTKSITVSANTTDAEATNTSASSGISGYRFKLDSGSWTGYQTSGEYTWDNLTQTTNHTITVEAKDNAGNTKQGTVSKGTGTVETASGGSFTPIGWTNGNVTVTLPTKPGYSTRYTTNGIMPTINSTEYSSSFTVSNNCTIIYIYTDGTNIGGAGTLNIKNIDKTVPTISTALKATSVETNNISLSVGITDINSGLSIVEWYYGTTNNLSTPMAIEPVTTINGSTAGPTTAQIKTVKATGLKSGTTYYFKVVAYDVAGNKITTAEIKENTKDYGEVLPTEDTRTPIEQATAAKPEGSTIDSTTNEDTGIVMIDSNNNEWVWIEVPATVFTSATSSTDYNNIKADLIEYAKDYREGSKGQGCNWTDEWYDGCGLTQEEYNTNYNKMLSSIYTNKGFYIGRYEAGIEGSDTNTSLARYWTTKITSSSPKAVSKKDMIPYNYVRCSDAQQLASKMSTGNKTSSLMYGIQWDLVCKFLEVKRTPQADIKEDSTNWGNYYGSTFTINSARAKKYNYSNKSCDNITGEKSKSSSILLTTGASEYTNKMNIYDFAGNEYEWTLEKTTYTNYPCSYRGGFCYRYGNDVPASRRNNNGTTHSNFEIGLRPSLY